METVCTEAGPQLPSITVLKSLSNLNDVAKGLGLSSFVSIVNPIICVSLRYL